MIMIMYITYFLSELDYLFVNVLQLSIWVYFNTLRIFIRFFVGWWLLGLIISPIVSISILCLFMPTLYVLLFILFSFRLFFIPSLLYIIPLSLLFISIPLKMRLVNHQIHLLLKPTHLAHNPINLLHRLVTVLILNIINLRHKLILIISTLSTLSILSLRKCIILITRC